MPPCGGACAYGAVRCLGAVGGRSVCRPHLGARLGPGRSGGHRGRGAGGCSASVRPSASLVQAPKRASLALLSPWSVWSPYFSGWCPCASFGARFDGGAVWRPCVPAGGWRAGWQAGWRRGLPRSLWERAGESPGARGAWTQWRSAPGAAALSGGRGRGECSPGLAGGYRAHVSQPVTGIPRAGGGGEGGMGRSPVPLPPFGPPVHFSGGCGVWLEGPGPGPPHSRVLLRVRGRLDVTRELRHRRAGLRRGSLLGGCALPGALNVRVAGGGVFAAGWPRAPLPATCLAGALRRPPAPDAARGVSSWRVSPCCRVRPCAGRRWRPVTVPPSARPGARAAGGGGRGDGTWLSGPLSVAAPTQAAGLYPPPARDSGPGPLGAGPSFWLSPTVPLLPASPRCCGVWGGGGAWAGARGCWGRRPGPAVSGEARSDPN